jgi:hypothetical protein
MLASDTVTKDPDQKKSNLIFHSRVHLENFAPAIFVRITPEKQLARAMLKNKAAGHEAWMNLLANPVKRCGLDVAQRSRLATPSGRIRSESRPDSSSNGAPEGIRTPDPQIRSLVLYPAELPAPHQRNICPAAAFPVK